MILFAFQISAIITSCCQEDYYVQWNDFAIKEKNIVDNSIVVANSRININNYKIEIYLKDTTYFIANLGIHLINIANATSCGENLIKINDLKRIKILTVFDINDQYPANSDISDFFIAKIPDLNISNLSLQDLIKTINNHNDFYDRKNEFDLTLNGQLTINKLSKFRMIFEFTDTTIISRETTGIELYQ